MQATDHQQMQGAGTLRQLPLPGTESRLLTEYQPGHPGPGVGINMLLLPAEPSLTHPWRPGIMLQTLCMKAITAASHTPAQQKGFVIKRQVIQKITRAAQQHGGLPALSGLQGMRGAVPVQLQLLQWW